MSKWLTLLRNIQCNLHNFSYNLPSVQTKVSYEQKNFLRNTKNFLRAILSKISWQHRCRTFSSPVSTIPGNVWFETMDATSDIVCITDDSSSKLSKLHVVWSVQLKMSSDILFPSWCPFPDCAMAETSSSILFSKLVTLSSSMSWQSHLDFSSSFWIATSLHDTTNSVCTPTSASSIFWYCDTNFRTFSCSFACRNDTGSFFFPSFVFWCFAFSPSSGKASASIVIIWKPKINK